MMSNLCTTAWGQIPLALNQLCLATVLRSGQSFRWKTLTPGVWSCGFHDRIISLRQDDANLYYQAHFQKQLPKNDDTELIVKDYLNLSVDLEALYKKWAKVDHHFKKVSGEFRGIRMLRQDPWECLIGFICSSNNNIARISQMVENLCSNFGRSLGSLPRESVVLADNGTTQTIFEPYEFYAFPVPKDLTHPMMETSLRNLGFGYRAKYIAKTALIIANDKPAQFLNDLRNKYTYKEAHEALLEMSGVGPKVADCVCLMSLDKMEAVPVDTHVWQIALRDYKFKTKGKSMTKSIYDAVGDHFRDLWGAEAGWAHSVLFTADLRAFSDRLKASKTQIKLEVVEKIKMEPEEQELLHSVAITNEKSRSKKRKVNGQVETKDVKTVIMQESTTRRTRRRAN